MVVGSGRELELLGWLEVASHCSFGLWPNTPRWRSRALGMRGLRRKRLWYHPTAYL